jgi:formyltetrahydrofolate-dependent phosphoribosylglycinamide formyltransferase
LNICVFASGAGSNFKAILDSIKKGFLKSKVCLLITNNPDCGAVKIAESNCIGYAVINKKLYNGLSAIEYQDKFLEELRKHKTDLIVLAGYMKMIEPEVLKKFKNKIINIHPALLPSFGGKEMYGINVHKAVIASGVKVTGITVHFVNENYDEGKIIFQKCCDVKEDDDEFSLQKRVLKLEHRYYPQVIKSIENLEIGISDLEF